MTKFPGSLPGCYLDITPLQSFKMSKGSALRTFVGDIDIQTTFPFDISNCQGQQESCCDCVPLHERNCGNALISSNSSKLIGLS